jgi:hypothetical protein
MLAFRIPSLDVVTATATRSGVATKDADTRSVFTPMMVGMRPASLIEKANSTSVGANGAVGVNAMTNVWVLPAGISTGVLGVPVTALVVGSVV